MVLMAPQGNANIGAAARAMKNYGINDLRLVKPASPLTVRAYTWAMGARNVLDGAQVFAHLDEALGDMAQAVAFTRRTGRMRRQTLSLEEAAPWIVSRAKAGGVALVFGREDSGLTNAEIKRADAIVTIPTCEAFPSLNLAQAVLLACYEVNRQLGSQAATGPEQHAESFISREEIVDVLNRIKEALDGLGYRKSGKDAIQAKILHRIERIIGRAGLSDKDQGMIEGLATRIIQRVKK